MNANTKVVEHVSVNMKDSGAAVLEETFKYSKTIGKTIAAKLGLEGDEADAKAAQIQRTLRRVRLALENR